MQNVGQEIACLVIILGASAVGQPALANDRADASDQDASDAGRCDSAGLVDSDMGIGHLPNLAPGDGGTANVEDAAPPQNGGLQAELLPDGISQPPNTPGAENRKISPNLVAHSASETGLSEHTEDLPIVAARAVRAPAKRVPVPGPMADVGVPDGLIGRGAGCGLRLAVERIASVTAGEEA